ncbi:MAG: hypothetical protein Q9222_003938 [Ikaeria aurantiellina]
MSSEALQPPPDGDVDLRGRFMAGIIVMTVIAVSFAWLRMYTRQAISHNLWWDDWIMFAASLVTIVTDAFLIQAYHLGLGRHVFYVPPKDVPETFKWLWAAEPTNLFAVFLVRLSIALFFLRLVPPKKRYIWTIWATIGILAASDIYICINFFFECRPIRKVWLPDTPGTCFSDIINQSALWLFQGIVAELCLWAPLELCVGMICGSIPTLRPLVTYWQKRSSKDSKYYDRCGTPVKLESYQKRSHHSHHGPSSNYSISHGDPSFLRSTSQEHMVEPVDRSRILKTQDIEISYKNAPPPTKTSETPYTGWNVV